MRLSIHRKGVSALLLCMTICIINAQAQTVGLILSDSAAFNGYTLFSPIPYPVTYLIDNDGMLVHSWERTDRVAGMAYFLETGELLRPSRIPNQNFNTSGAGGFVELIDWEGNTTWEFTYNSDQYRPHHDIEPLPNGNVLMIAWELKTYAEAIAAGRDTALLVDGELWPDHIIEVEPTGPSGGNIVWEWHVWDHLIQDFDSTKENYGVVADHPELIDLNWDPGGNNAGIADCIHSNAIDYNEELDQIMLTVRKFSEIWIIDHSTTTAQAAGHSGGIYGKGGDLLYRWGNSQTYRHGTASDRKLCAPHDGSWIEEGNPGESNILVFNNGQGRPQGNYSTVEEIVPPIDSTGNYTIEPDTTYGPAEPIWIYQAANPTDFYSQTWSGAQRQPNGNTLICEAINGKFFEVTPDTDIVWIYINPVTDIGPVYQSTVIPPPENRLSKILRYAPEYPGFEGHTLVPLGPIELYPGVYERETTALKNIVLLQNTPNPFSDETAIRFQLANGCQVTLTVYDITGQSVSTLVDGHTDAGYHTVILDAGNFPNGVYYYQLKTAQGTQVRRCVLLKD
jgi:hypothetical protein